MNQKAESLESTIFNVAGHQVTVSRADLEQKNPGFPEAEYRTALAVGRMWAEMV